MDFTEALGKAIRAERAVDDLRQADVAKGAGVGTDTLRAIEAGIYERVQYTQIEAIARALGCDLMYLHARASAIMARAAGGRATQVTSGGQAMQIVGDIRGDVIVDADQSNS